MKGFRTIIFNLLAAIIPVLEMFGMELGLEGNYKTAYYFVIIAGNIILRFKTNTTIGKKK